MIYFRDAQGQTPFMLAVSSRSYPAALELFERIIQLGTHQEQEEMIFPKGSNPDQSPLHVLCCNDTCSFTWTGAEHINQVSSIIDVRLKCIYKFGIYLLNLALTWLHRFDFWFFFGLFKCLIQFYFKISINLELLLLRFTLHVKI